MKKKRVLDFFTRENIGILLAFIACLIFWFPYEYIEKFLFFHVKRHLDLKPDLITGLVALGVMFILYIRKIIYCDGKVMKYVSLCVNLTLIATIVQIFLNPTNVDKIHRSDVWFLVCIATIAAVVAIMIFGVQEIAKVAVLVGILFLCMSNLAIVNEAMGFMGFVNILVILSSFYFQQNVRLEGLKQDFYYLVRKNGSVINNS